MLACCWFGRKERDTATTHRRCRSLLHREEEGYVSVLMLPTLHYRRRRRDADCHASAEPSYRRRTEGESEPRESDEGGKTEKRELVTSTAAYRRTATADVPLLVFDVAAETLPPVIVV
nr:hypothetical protein Itr_chr06CG13890 [Ipomoea trifida]